MHLSKLILVLLAYIGSSAHATQWVEPRGHISNVTSWEKNTKITFKVGSTECYVDTVLDPTLASVMMLAKSAGHNVVMSCYPNTKNIGGINTRKIHRVIIL